MWHHMFVIFLAGGIASGKSTAADEFRALGAEVVDLDQISRQVVDGSIHGDGAPCLQELVDAFGPSIVDDEGFLDRGTLASAAFIDEKGAETLEAIEMPYIRHRLGQLLTPSPCDLAEPEVLVVEVPLLDRIEDMVPLADAVIAVTVPVEERRRRAVGRGMDGADFDRRAANQPSDDYLASHATDLIDNRGGEGELREAVDRWWDLHVVPRCAVAPSTHGRGLARGGTR